VHLDSDENMESDIQDKSENDQPYVMESVQFLYSGKTISKTSIPHCLFDAAQVLFLEFPFSKRLTC
jgi:hypothetical protein